MTGQNGTFKQAYVYETNAEHVERHKYKVKIMPRTQRLPEPVLNREIEIFYHPINPHVPELTLMTIRELIELTGLNEYWEIIYDADVINIIRFLNAYIYELRELIAIGSIEKNLNNIIFIKNMTKFHGQIIPIGLRVLNRHPDLLEIFKGSESPLLSGLKAFGTHFSYVNNPFDYGNQIKAILNEFTKFTDQETPEKTNPKNNDASQFITFTTPF